MARQSKAQKETVSRVMHEFKHGELESSTGKPVRSKRQAVAIALHEGGASKEESPASNRRALSHTKARERKGETARDADEGKTSARRKPAARKTTTAATETSARKKTGATKATSRKAPARKSPARKSPARKRSS
ncbi:MAG: hypothetical protein JWM36_815 [Hyphomicrobiales bacterium]|nr:hypothetical protein [Hyphomicrobiales bacterium]